MAAKLSAFEAAIMQVHAEARSSRSAKADVLTSTSVGSERDQEAKTLCPQPLPLRSPAIG